MSEEAAPEIVVRRAMANDAGELGTLGALLVQEHFEFDPLRFLPVTTRTAAGYGSFLRSQLDDPESIVLVAEEHGRVIGYAYAAVEGIDYKALRGPAAVLHDLIVAPGHRGRGIGQRLLVEVLSQLAARGAPRAVLSTAARNAAAQRLFARMGFRPTMVEMTRESTGA
jgi:ribosomal protein S18 acetylase RimI-like enzyme